MRGQWKVKKHDYEKYLKPEEFRKLYEEWASAGKPTGNHSMYVQIFDGVTNAVKACIGALQSKYNCTYQDYNEKVMDGTILIIDKLLKMNEPPRNIVNMAYLPVLGICCGPKAIQSEWETEMLSTDNETNAGDAFCEMLYLDEDGTVVYVNY